MRWRFGLAAKMVLAIATVSAATSYAAFQAHANLTAAAIERIETERAAGLRGAIGALLAQLVSVLKQTAKLLSQQPQLVAAAANDAPPAERRRRVAALLDQAYRVVEVGILEVIDRDQSVLYRAHAPERFGDVQTLWGLAEALAGNEASATAPDRNTGLAMRVVVPLGARPQPVAALSVGVLVDDGFARRVAAETRAMVAILSPRGEVLAASAPREQVDPLVNLKAVARSLQEKQKAHPGPASGELTTVFFAQTLLDQTYVWMVAVDSRYARSQAAQARDAALRVSLLIGGLSATLLGWLAHRHSARLRVLQREAEQAAQHLGVDEVRRKNAGDEIDALAAATRAMAERLTTHAEKLQIAREAAVAELLQKDAELRRRETMAQLGSLVAGVAHEVRNPLFGITSTLDALQARMHEQSGHQRHIAVLRGETARLQKLMQDLLDYGKPAPVERSPTDLFAVIERAIESCAGLSQGRDVRVVCQLSGTAPPLSIDPRGMHQVFVNLIENALQLSPPGSKVTVAAGRGSSDEASPFVCTVADSGPGFLAKDLERVFEPFFTRRRGGTGLGLSIVQRIVDAHGGTISATNRTEGGALMTLCLPAPERTRRSR